MNKKADMWKPGFNINTAIARALMDIEATKAVIENTVPIPLISPPDSEGIRHAIPKDVATLFRIMSPPLGSERSDAGF